MTNTCQSLRIPCGKFVRNSLALAISIGACSSGIAQEGSALQEITVTAQFREQSLQQTPIAITATNSEMMEARSQTSLNEVAAQAPNVTLEPNSAAYGPSMTASIRGVGQYDFNPAVEPGVGLYVDDVYYATLTGSILDLLDLERVEILRGPQGTLAGKNSIGGAIKLYSQKPEGLGTGSFQAAYGTRDRLDLRGSTDIAITDELSMRLSGVSKQQEGYVDRIDYGCAFPESGIPPLYAVPASGDCTIAKEGEVDYTAARGMLRWFDGGPLDIMLTADYTNDNRTQAPGVLIVADYQGTADINPYDVPIALDDRFVPPEGSYYNYASYANLEDGTRQAWVGNGRSRYEGWGTSAHIDWDMADQLQLQSITAYREYESGFSNDNDYSPMAHSFGEGDLNFWSYSQELRLNGSVGNENGVDWTLGAFYMNQESVYPSLQDLRYAGLPAFYQNDPIDAETSAVFAHANWFATDNLSFVLGLRWTDESKTYTFYRSTPDGGSHPVLGPLNGEVGDYEGDQIDYRASIQYQFNDLMMGYVQIATGFKGGGINPRPFFATQVQPFEPEELTSYEVGMKTELLDRRLRLNGAIFFSDYTDKQLTASSCPAFTPTPSGAPCALPINAGDADMKGFELEGTYQAYEGLMLDVSLSYLDFEYQSVNPLAADIELSDVAPYTPEWKWSMGLQYEFALPGGSTLTPRVDFSYQSDMYSDPSNSPYSYIDDYTLGNARLTWRSPSEEWQASLEITNFTDEYYYMTIFDQYDNNGVASGQPGRPMEWAMSIKRNF